LRNLLAAASQPPREDELGLGFNDVSASSRHRGRHGKPIIGKPINGRRILAT